jgi:nicotinate-nucleotide pyrophosphorylase (carboxylating)
MNTFDATLDSLVRLALAEDIGSGDVTTRQLVDEKTQGMARVVAKEELVLAGSRAFERVFSILSSEVTCRFLMPEADAAQAGQTVAELEGPFAALLTGERTALNFLQRLSGIATLTRQYVENIKGHKAVLLDTRKTTPGWRALEKAAVRQGGGTNHRSGLFDALLIKENHIAACGGITAALSKARSRLGPLVCIEIEVRTLAELEQALAGEPDVIMLDNMGLEDLRSAVRRTAGRVPLEASGNVTLATIEGIASTGVDYISSGAVTHSAPAVDFSMLIQRV